MVCCCKGGDTLSPRNGQTAKVTSSSARDDRWEGRYTADYDPETGKAIYKNALARTQKERKEKLAAALEQTGKVDVHKTG